MNTLVASNLDVNREIFEPDIPNLVSLGQRKMYLCAAAGQTAWESSIRRVYLLPNLITSFSLACGLFVIFRMALLAPGQANYMVFQASALLLILATLADLLDGATARLMRAQSEFGGLFDSLSDAVTFGVAPAVMVIKSLGFHPENRLALLGAAAAMLYAVCGVLRLARYNAQTPKKEPEKETGEKPPAYRMFTGMPIPAAAAAIVSGTLFLISPISHSWWPLDPDTRAIILTCMLVVIGYFMVSRWRFPGINLLHFRIESFNLVLFTVALAIVLFYGILRYFSLVFAIGAWGYFFTACGLSLTRLLTGKRILALKDFDRAKDDPDIASE